MSNALEHILNKINEAQLIQDPWPYLFIEEYVPESFYKKLINETTSIHFQIGASRRQIQEVLNTWYDISPISSNYGGETLQEYCDIVSSKDLQDAIYLKFADFLKKYGHVNYVNKSQDIVGVVTEYDVITRGWKYPIHSDIKKKLFTHLHYLAVEGDDKSIGTRLYPNTGKGNSLDFDKDCLMTLPYLPNSVLIFCPSNVNEHRTNHAVCHRSKQTNYRRSLHTFYHCEFPAPPLDQIDKWALVPENKNLGYYYTVEKEYMYNRSRLAKEQVSIFGSVKLF